MDINAPLDGFCELIKLGPQDSNRSDETIIRLQIPLVFSQVATVERAGFWDCTIQEARTAEGERLATSGRAKVRPYSPDNREREITTRPVWLQPIEPGEANTLLFDFDIRIPGESRINLDQKDLTVSIVLVFSSLTSIRVALTVEPSITGGVLHIKSMKRATKALPVLRNLTLLIMPTIIVGWWNLWQNGQVHEQPRILTAGVVSLFVGAALAFFGLSLVRIKSWVKTLANLSGLVRFPEVHLDTAAGRFLATRQASWFLSVTSILAIILCAYQWSVQVPKVETSDLRLYDKASATLVSAPRVLLRHIFADRFVIVCAPDGVVRDEFLVLGGLTPGLTSAKLKEEGLLVEFPEYLDPERARLGQKTIEGFAIPEFDLAGAADVLKPHACGTRDPRNGEFGVSSRVSNGHATLTITSMPAVNIQILEGILETFKKHKLKNAKFKELWTNRRRWIAEVQKDLSTVPGWISPDDAVKTIGKLWNQIDISPDGKTLLGPEKTLERAILARGLLEHFSQRSSTRFEEAHATELVELFQKRFASISFKLDDKNDYRAIQAHWEVLLEAERMTSTYNGKFHKAIVGPEARWIKSWPGEYSLHYLRACLNTGVLDSEDGVRERKQFFQAVLSGIYRVGGFQTVSEIQRYLSEREGISNNALFALLADDSQRSEA